MDGKRDAKGGGPELLTKRSLEERPLRQTGRRGRFADAPEAAAQLQASGIARAIGTQLDE